MTNVMIWDPFGRTLWGAALTILFICAFQWFNVGRKKELFNEKLFLFGNGILVFSVGLAFAFAQIAEVYIEGSYINYTFYGDFGSFTNNYLLFIKLSWISLTLGFSLWLLTFEMIIKRTKYILTMLSSLFVVLIIATPYKINYFIITNIFTPLLTLSLIIIYLLYAKWAQYELKAISSVLLFGSLIAMIGALLDQYSVRSTNAVPLIIAPIFFILGALLMTSPTLIDPKHFSRARIYWLSSGVLIIITSWSLLSFMIILGVLTGYIIITFIIIIVVAMFMLYYSMRIIKSQPFTEVKDKRPNILKSFTKPQKVTEEEVSISKEKKVCLVCKGKISRFNNYICPECDVLYCENCARALSELENMCWVCETPFDESKPVKPFKKEEKEEISVEEKIQKNGKDRQDIKP